jgi:hypothetical protein
MAKKKYCNRCAHEMWYSEDDKRWYCTNPKCVKYKPQPEPTPEPEDNGEEDTEGKTVEYVPDKTEDNGEEDSDEA